VFWQSIDFDRGGAIDRVTGTDWVASVYAPEQKRWWLCDSSFEGRQTAHSTFIR
jgi:hypothetical protein